ncbi:ABC transporter permease [Oleiagrimonas sp. MCCC 1A03011]|uniref:ABC transporter permease n=1 Tax=Oleiagrimonas sp. MCCC 1A03011 TaxID=1926883 RepID=UPI000DC29987|nr:ABC transporter permease [Oleiagrimonas sp. MCCC 1A03011]RAP58512.1 peptide ABC transporter permease [Oleiagrimonas sp. MCCC 1A03011]
MLAYYLRLGVRSLRRNPMLTLLMVLAVGFGVAASMTTYAVFRAVSGNPIPDKSAKLFKPQIDNWGHANGRTSDDPPNAMDYTDAMALMKTSKASMQTVSYPVGLSVIPADPKAKPFDVTGYATYADFFPMFEVPFEFGGAWPASDDAQHAPVAVISEKVNQRLFGGANSVGRSIDIEGHRYRIAGVTRTWNPQPRFFDVNNTGGFAPDPPEIWIPFTRAVDLQIPTWGNNNCNVNVSPGWKGWLYSECVWLSYWVELPDAAAAARYKNYLHAYAAQQQQAGRFDWPPNVRLHNVTEWLADQHVVPQESQVSLFVALGFLVVCLVNTIGLLLAKFMRRAPEIGVRRALGASRGEVYRQFLAEAAMVGVAGGVLGLLLTACGVLGIGMVFDPDIARLARVDVTLVVLTLLVAVFATVIAAFYPTWRAARVQPAWQLKSN